jgi:ribose transport system permease protein
MELSGGTTTADPARERPALSRSASSAASTAAKFLLRRIATSRLTGVMTALVALCIYLGVTEPAFTTAANWRNIAMSNAVIAVLAVGMTFPVLTGCFDMSVGSMAAAASVFCALGFTHGLSWPLACLVGLGGGAMLGLTNGVLIGIGRIPFFVVTLGALSVYQSVALLVSKTGETISVLAVPAFQPIEHLVNGAVWGIPNVLFAVTAIYLIAAGVLRYSAFGRAVFAVGSNREAARLAGINVPLVFVSVFTLAGLLTGLGAIGLVGRLTAATPTADPNLMLTVIAAVLIGGNSFHGGEGGLFGTAMGVLFFAVIQDGLTLANISAFWVGTVSGTILIASIAVGVMRDYRWQVIWQRIGRPSRRTNRSASDPNAGSY